jgi:hypothetical protein
MNRLDKSLRLLPEAMIDPEWPQKALAMQMQQGGMLTRDIARKLGVPVDRVSYVLRVPDRIDRVARMRQWSNRNAAN